MPTYTDRTFSGRLSNRLQEAYAERMEQLLNVKTWEEFQERRGFLRALKDVQGLMTEVNKELSA